MGMPVTPVTNVVASTPAMSAVSPLSSTSPNVAKQAADASCREVDATAGRATRYACVALAADVTVGFAGDSNQDLKRILVPSCDLEALSCEELAERLRAVAPAEYED